MSGKNTSWLIEAAKSFDIRVCKIQNLKVGSVPAAYPTASTKAFCEFAIMQL